MQVTKILNSIFRDERGATAIEYGLIAGLIVIAIVASMSRFANASNAMWTKVQTEVENASNG